MNGYIHDYLFFDEGMSVLLVILVSYDHKFLLSWSMKKFISILWLCYDDEPFKYAKAMTTMLQLIYKCVNESCKNLEDEIVHLI